MSIDPKYLDDAWPHHQWRAHAAAVIQADLAIGELQAIQQATARQHLKRRIQQRIDAMQASSWPLGPYHDERWPEGTAQTQYQTLKADDALTADELREALDGTSRLTIVKHLEARLRGTDHRSIANDDVPIYGEKLKLRKELAVVFARDIVGLSKMGLIRSCIEAVCEYAIQHDVNVWEAARMVSTEIAETQADDIEDTRIEYDDEWDG